jgi:hypothetical protein
VKDGCTAWCASVVAANCSKKTTEPDCVFGCRAIAGSATCNERYKQLFACAQGATFACSKEGDAVPQGCEAKYAQAALCVLGHPDESLQAPCKGYCDRAEAAACPNSVPSSECVYGCEVQSSVVPTCTTDWKTFVSCAQTAEVQCNAKGDPSPDACAASYLKYVACVAEVAQ